MWAPDLFGKCDSATCCMTQEAGRKIVWVIINNDPDTSLKPTVI